MNGGKLRTAQPRLRSGSVWGSNHVNDPSDSALNAPAINLASIGIAPGNTLELSTALYYPYGNYFYPYTLHNGTYRPYTYIPPFTDTYAAS